MHEAVEIGPACGYKVVFCCFSTRTPDCRSKCCCPQIHSVNICIPAAHRGQTTAFCRRTQSQIGWESNTHFIWFHKLCAHIDSLQCSIHSWDYMATSPVEFHACLTYSPSPYAPSIAAQAFTDREKKLEIHFKTLNIPTPPARLAPGHVGGSGCKGA